MIYLDIETLDFFQDERIKSLARAEQLAAIRFGIAVTYWDQRDEWREWLPDQIIELWRYLNTDIVAGWNIVEFDIPVIEYNLSAIGHNYVKNTIMLFDVFQRIRTQTGRWYKLEVIAQINLERGKSANGQQAAECLRDWHDKGNQASLRKALDYCHLDVELERDLYLHLAEGKPLRLPPRWARQELNEILWWLDGRIERIPDAAGALSKK